jgi:hypothetical protein
LVFPLLAVDTRPAFRFDFLFGIFAGFKRALGFAVDRVMKDFRSGRHHRRTTSTPLRPATRGVRSRSACALLPSPTATLHSPQKSSKNLSNLVAGSLDSLSKGHGSERETIIEVASEPILDAE